MSYILVHYILSIFLFLCIYISFIKGKYIIVRDKDITDNKVMAVLAYIGILFLIPLLAAPNSRFARFHANQGLVLFLAEVVLGAAGGVLGLIPFVGWIISSAIGIVCLAFMIIGIVNAANGKAKELPLIGSFKLIK